MVRRRLVFSPTNQRVHVTACFQTLFGPNTETMKKNVGRKFYKETLFNYCRSTNFYHYFLSFFQQKNHDLTFLLEKKVGAEHGKFNQFDKCHIRQVEPVELDERRPFLFFEKIDLFNGFSLNSMNYSNLTVALMPTFTHISMNFIESYLPHFLQNIRNIKFIYLSRLFQTSTQLLTLI